MSKTIETNLQSNEIRLPKVAPQEPAAKNEMDDLTPTSATATSPGSYFKSSFARSLSFSTVNGGHVLESQNFTRSLDFDINFSLDTSPTSSNATPTSASPAFENGCLLGMLGGPVDGLPNGKEDVAKNVAASQAKASSAFARKSLDSNDIEVLRLRKECQNLVEENRRLMNLATNSGYIVNGNVVGGQTVETVILQTQVETLQWQLKQVDASRQMYRAVMEEVSRYLERCHRSLESMQLSPIGRSKSVLHVSKPNHDSDSSNGGSPRARSSTNLIDVQKCYAKIKPPLEQILSPPTDDECPPSPASYSTFRDFTWRRSPKRTQTLPPSSNSEVEPEKLAKEAFRLFRTVQNLLNTQEPLLSQSTHALDTLISSSTSTLTSHHQFGTGFPHHPIEPHYASVLNTRSNVGFNRKFNMRGSRLSLRSSTDDSVHSTSSSNKTETDEDNTDRPSPPLIPPHHHHNHHPHPHVINHRHSANIERIKEMMISSSQEDESGFSSMNSFQEIGLPLINSTMMSMVANNGPSGGSTGGSSAASSTDESTTEMSSRENVTVIPTSSNVATPSKLDFSATDAFNRSKLTKGVNYKQKWKILTSKCP